MDEFNNTNDVPGKYAYTQYIIGINSDIPW